jgi:glycosyltransferase involved in cell wall biosynthesis
MDDNKTVSIIMRTIDGRLDSLERSVFSIFCNGYQHKQVVLVYQGTDKEYFHRLKHLEELYPGLDFKIVQNPTDKDERGKNLNIGIENSDGRYICFLDDDDVIYPNHLTKLVNTISEAGKAWAYSQVCIDIERDGYVVEKEYKFIHKEFSYLKLWNNNYIPINTLLIDKYKITDKSLLSFSQSMKMYEDYAFLLKLAFYFEPAVCPDVTSIYKIRRDGSNTVIHKLSPDHPEYEHKKQEQQSAQNKITEIKNEIASSHYWSKEILTGPDLNQFIRNRNAKPIWNIKTRLGRNKCLRVIIEKIMPPGH